MPLPDLYKSMLSAEWGDIKNVGGRAAGSITATLFLSEFVSNTKWAHLDVAGSAFYDNAFHHLKKVVLAPWSKPMIGFVIITTSIQNAHLLVFFFCLPRVF